jgi:tetratricopeptide (TPR) repeat protein
MVLPAPPAHASLVEPHWFDKLVVAIELSAQGVLTLVDNAALTRLREAYLRLRARDPATDLIVDVRRLAELPPGTTVILVLKPPISGDDLDWLNLNRPLVSDRRHNVVLWCEDDAAGILARGAPDFFDWISARVDCPPAPAAHAVADVKAAIRARASGIAWAGPGLEDTLAAVRPGRPIRRIAVASYQSMIDALASREPGWLFLDGVDTEFHLRRLRWAMAEAGRRTIVFRRSLDRTLPGWWTVHAVHVPIVEVVHGLTAAGGTGRLAAMTGLDPAAYASAVFLLREGVAAARLEELLVTASDPRVALQDLARPLGWTMAGVFTKQPPQQISVVLRHAFESDAARHKRDDDPVVAALRGQPREPQRWRELGRAAHDDGDFEVAIRWLTSALRSLPDDAPALHIAVVLAERGRAHRLAGDHASARGDLEQAYASARGAGHALLMAASAVALGDVLLDQGEPQRAREYLEAALSASTELGDHEIRASLLDTLARSLLAQHDLVGASQHLERALSIKRRVFAAEAHPSIAVSLGALGGVLVMQGDLDGGRHYLERSLEIFERSLGPAHPNVGATLSALARVHRDTGDLPGARAHLERALAIERAALGSDHP